MNEEKSLCAYINRINSGKTANADAVQSTNRHIIFYEPRWAISHFIRVSVISRLLKSLDFNIQEDTPSRLKDIQK